MVVCGTRPDAVKMAPLVTALRQCSALETTCCVTAQHRDMLDAVLDVFSIVPDDDLDIMTHGQSLSDITARVLERMQGVLARRAPELVLVHGDTTTGFASALAAFYAKIPVGHVEAGLRTHNRYSPFPEELNRQLIGRLAALHFCPTQKNKDELAAEGVTSGVWVTGNTIIDAMKSTVSADYRFENEALRALDFNTQRILLVTAHRRENYGAPLENLCRALRTLTQRFGDVRVIYPVHPAPVVRGTADSLLGGAERVTLLQPLSLTDMHNLMARCHFVLTDSGGLQEEAPALGKPVLVLRRETERPEAVEAGTAKLIGVEEEDVVREATRLLTDQIAYDAMADAVSPYGDGRACERIVQCVLHMADPSAPPPEPFST